jgi:hypothetical protein
MWARILEAVQRLPTRERRRLGGTEVVKAGSDANRAHFVQNLQNSHPEPARTPALPGKGFRTFTNRWIASLARAGNICYVARAEARIHLKSHLRIWDLDLWLFLKLEKEK